MYKITYIKITVAYNDNERKLSAQTRSAFDKRLHEKKNIRFLFSIIILIITVEWSKKKYHYLIVEQSNQIPIILIKY